MTVCRYKNYTPEFDKSVFIASGSVVIGNVVIGSTSSVWFNSVVRGDEGVIRIGSNTNIQDLCVLHCEHAHPLTVGNNVTVGHRSIIHGCTIEDNCLIGMGAVIMNGAVIGRGSVVAAGSVVMENDVIAPFSLVAGVPAKLKKEISEDIIRLTGLSADGYSHLACEYSSEFEIIE